MSNRSTFTPDFHARLTKPPAPAIPISRAMVESIRNLNALGIYVYAMTDPGNVTLSDLRARFPLTDDEIDIALAELGRLGLIGGDHA